MPADAELGLGRAQVEHQRQLKAVDLDRAAEVVGVLVERAALAGGPVVEDHRPSADRPRQDLPAIDQSGPWTVVYAVASGKMKSGVGCFNVITTVASSTASIEATCRKYERCGLRSSSSDRTRT